MNIIFMGTPDFAVPSLKALLNTNHKISAVVTVKDKPKGRGLSLSESPVKKFAKENNLDILQPESLRDAELINNIKKLEPHLIVVVAFRILPPELFNIPEYGSVNLHASLLPKYRGAAPINWALIKGDKETGVTAFFLQEKVDKGNIIMQKVCAIDEYDNAGTLHDKLSLLGASLIADTVDLISNDKKNISVITQDESQVTLAPKITPEFCFINWHQDNRTIHNFIRGLSPHPAAYTFYNDKRFKIFSSYLTDMRSDKKPGSLFIDNDKLFVSCENNFIGISEMQMEGKKRMMVNEFLKGFKFESDKIFTSSTNIVP